MNTARQLLLDNNDNGSDKLKLDFSFGYENDFKPKFTCVRCGKAEYRNGEFETIKLGDIFTHITHFPSGASPGDDNICTQCVDVNDNSQNVKTFQPSDVKSVVVTNHKSLPNHNNNNNQHTENFNEDNRSNIMLGDTNSRQPSQVTHEADSSNIGASTNGHGLHHHHQQQQANQSNSTITVAVLPGSYGDIQQSSIVSLGNHQNGSRNGTAYLNHQQNLSKQPKYTINMVNSILETSQSPGDSLTTYVVSQLQEPGGNQPETSSIAPSISSSSSTTATTMVSSSSFASSTPSSSAPTNLQGAGISLTSSTTIVTPATTVIPNGTSSTTNGSSSPGTTTITSSNGTLNSKECTICKKVFKSNKIATLHFQRVHEKVGKYCCHVCGIRFSYRGSLDSHLASHTTPEITHNCPTCGQKFKEKSNLTNHMKVHSDNPKKFMCEFCPSGFSKRVNLRYHIKRKHPDQVANSVVLNGTPGVNNSGNNSSVASPLAQQQQHQDSSNNGKMNQSYQSPGMNMGASASPGNMTNNNKSPNNNKDKPQGNFKCEHCGRMFLFKNNLKAHLRTHTRDKKYTCEICEKSFIYKESLKNHMLLHSNELPYLCDICGKKFRDRSNRRKHVKNVHKYLFTNGDGTPSAGPGNSTMANNNKNFKVPSVPDPTQQQQSAEPASGNNGGKKKRNNGKKNQSDINNTSDADKRDIIKSTNNNGKKRGGAGNATESASPMNKSVIVSIASGMTSASLGAADQDRKIIMSPSPKNNMGSPVEYTRLPVTVHVPASPAGSLHQHYVNTATNRNQNVIVKASSASPSSADMELYHRNQNVIVYPKSKGNVNVITDYTQSSSVISQTSLLPHSQQQQQSHIPQQPQYYTDDPGSYDQGAVATSYMNIPMATITSSGQESQQRSTQMIYEYGPAPPQVQGVKSEDRGSDPQQSQQPQQIRYEEPGPENADQVQYSGQSSIYATASGGDGGYHIHHSDPQQHQSQQQQQHQYWTLATVSSADPNNQSQVSMQSDGSTPYSTASTISPPVVSYESPITAASNVLNAPSYAQPDNAEAAANNFFYKDLSQFDFSYL